MTSKRVPIWLDESFDNWLTEITAQVNKNIPSDRKLSKREVSKMLSKFFKPGNVVINVDIIRGKRRDKGKLNLY